MKVFDISKGVLSTPVYPGDPEPVVKQVRNYTQGDAFRLTVLSACVHTGTHIDAPAHFIPNGATVENIAVEQCVGECLVASDYMSHNGESRLLLRGNGKLSPDICVRLYEKGVRLLGVEAASVGPIEAPMECHLALLSRGVIIIENLDLSSVSDGKYFLCAPPVLIEGADGAFCRALLFSDIQ